MKWKKNILQIVGMYRHRLTSDRDSPRQDDLSRSSHQALFQLQHFYLYILKQVRIVVHKGIGISKAEETELLETMEL